MKEWAIMGLALLSWMSLAEPARAEDAPRDAARVAQASGGHDSGAKDGAQADAFDVLEYDVEGNTVLPAAKIEEAVYPYLGEKKTIKEVERARTALEDAYHAAGYLTVLVDIPEQEVKSGHVRLKVTEAKVSRLKVSGSRYYSLGWIKRNVPSLAEGGVPYFPDVQKELTDLARTPDRQVVPVLRAGRAPGTVEVELDVKDQFPLHGSLEANDRYGPNTSHSRLVASLRYDNLWQRQHSLSLSYQVAPEKPSESNVLSGTYVIPGVGGQAYALYAVRSRSDVAATGGFNTLGKGNFYGLRWIKPLRARDEAFFHSITLGADYKDSFESVQGGGDTSIDTPIEYTPFVLDYAGGQRWEKGLTQFDLAANFHFRGLRGNEQEFSNKRYLASASYFYLRGSLQHTQAMGRWNLYGKVSGQAASGPLISNEQFGVGGVDTVRGYLESEALGDVGYQGTIELRTPPLIEPQQSGLTQAYALAFVEGAKVRIFSPLPQQQEDFVLSSAGVGLRLQGFKGFRFNLDWAMPFKGLTYTHAREPRFHASVAYEF